MTAVSSILLLVVRRSPPHSSRSWPSERIHAPQPPTPGLPLQAPSVHMSTWGFVSSVTPTPYDSRARGRGHAPRRRTALRASPAPQAHSCHAAQWRPCPRNPAKHAARARRLPSRRWSRRVSTTPFTTTSTILRATSATASRPRPPSASTPTRCSRPCAPTSTDTCRSAIVPVSGMLDLKALAHALGGKKAEMAPPADAERSSGYVVGGISPIGQRKALPTALDETAELYDVIYVSGGRRGLDIGLAPADLVAVTHADHRPHREGLVMAELAQGSRGWDYAAHLTEVRARIHTAEFAAGRAGSDVKLLVATKAWDADAAVAAVRAGASLVGESRMQELAAKGPPSRRRGPGFTSSVSCSATRPRRQSSSRIACRPSTPSRSPNACRACAPRRGRPWT